MNIYVKIAYISLFSFISFFFSCLNSEPMTKKKDEPQDQTHITFTKPISMPNIGNTCFSAAALQAFLSGTRSHITSKNYEPNSILGQLARMLITPNEEKLSAIFKRILQETGCPLGPQQDSLSFFTRFLSLVKKEDPDLISDFLIKRQLTIYSCGDHSDVDRSKVNLESTILTLSRLGSNIQEAVNASLKSPSNSCGIEGCSKDCIRTIKADWPKNLVLHVPSSPKPELSENMVIDKNSTNDDKNRKYDLIAVVVHIGSTGGGHYYAYVKYGNNWFKCNDSIISLVDKAEVFSKNLGFDYLIYQLNNY